MSSACWLPQQPYPTVVDRGADGQPSLRAVDSSCQARLLEIWVTLSKNRLLPWADGLPLHCTVRAGWCSACSGRRSLTYLAQRPMSWKKGGKAATSSCSLLQLELESEVSLGAGSDGYSLILCVSLGVSLLLFGFASG